jgi:hypothetical protein
MHREKVR